MHYSLLLIGLPMSGYGLLLLWRQIVFLSHSRRAWGQLTDWKEVPTRSKRYWYPIVTFTAHDGAEYRVVGAAGYSSKAGRNLGDHFPVRYDMNNPDRACISTFVHLWGGALGFLILGAGTLVAFAGKLRS